MDCFFPIFPYRVLMLIVFCINLDFILCNSDFDLILYYNLLLCFIPLEMHVRLICAIKFYLLTYFLQSLLIPAI